MAMNPMQRRSIRMFLSGLLIGLVAVAIAVVISLNKMKELQTELQSLKSLQKKYLVAAADLESGHVISFDDDFITATVQTTVSQDQVIDRDDFIEKDSNGNPIRTEEGELGKDVMLKVNVPAGTIVTKDMIVDTEDPVTGTDRIQEYNMILLPSHLKNGDYVDIRMTLTNGQDYIVLSKKRVLGCTAKSIWIKVNETEMQILNSAIVDSYLISGAKLYAIPYIEAGTQPATTQTYVVNQAVASLLSSMAGGDAENARNLVDEIKKDANNDYLKGKTARDLWEKYQDGVRSEERQNLEDAISNSSAGDGAVVSGFAVEKAAVQEARQKYVSELEGTEDIGYTKE